MQQTRQFTKRRPQSPSIHQQQSIDALKVGVNKPVIPRSGLAIQSNAPIHVSHRASPVHKEVHEHQPTSILNQYQRQEQDDGLNRAHGHTSKQDYLHDHSHQEHAHQHEHDHAGHDHHNSNHAHNHQGHNHISDYHGHSHNHHDHSHHGHDHHDHGHDHHDHGHGHHDHGHGHGHDHHGHNHNHKNFPQVYTQPLPSYSSIFASLAPSQKALFTCFIGHFLTGIIVWYMGAARESLAIVGFSYLVLFDSFGVLNNFVSSVLHLNPAFTNTSTKRPFGVKRFEVVFALANTIFLLFGTMYTTKESLEHLLLENHHSGDHHVKSSFPFGLLLMLSVAIFASFASNIRLRNHENLVNLRNKTPQLQQEYSYSDFKSAGGSSLADLKQNIYTSSIIATGLIVFVFNLFNIASPTLDKFVAFGESALMLYLGGTTAAALAKVLLQTMPDSIEHHVEHSIRQIQQHPEVVSVDKVHFWQNSYGKHIGTAEVFARPEANEDEVIDSSYKILEKLVKDGGELTVSVAKR